MMKRIAITLMLLVGAAVQAHAAEAKGNGTPEASWQRECSACHIAYPARFLSAADWEKLMSHLDQHFGDNASIDPETTKAIMGYLTHYAGRGSRHSSKSLRISDTPWFTREHRELPRTAWTNPAVKSASNCTACHVNAARGNWSEHGVRLPAGIRMEDEDDEE
jgi:Dihaem cytochrome c